MRLFIIIILVFFFLLKTICLPLYVIYCNICILYNVYCIYKYFHKEGEIFQKQQTASCYVASFCIV